MHDLDGTAVHRVCQTSEKIMEQMLAQKRIRNTKFLSNFFADRLVNMLRYLRVFAAGANIKKRGEIRERLITEYLNTLSQSLGGLTPKQAEVIMGKVAGRITLTPGYETFIRELNKADLGGKRETMQILCTSQPTMIAKKIGMGLGIDPELCFGSEFDVKNGALTGNIEMVMTSRRKAEILEKLGGKGTCLIR